MARPPAPGVQPTRRDPRPHAVGASLVSFADAIRNSRILRPEQLRELRGLVRLCREPRDLGRLLLERGWLTPFQVNEVNRGRAASLTAGPYLLLERLGQGAMGTVFKA